MTKFTGTQAALADELDRLSERAKPSGGDVVFGHQSLAARYYALKEAAALVRSAVIVEAADCETCDGSGEIDESLGGDLTKGFVPCPDCDGTITKEPTP